MLSGSGKSSPIRYRRISGGLAPMCAPFPGGAVPEGAPGLVAEISAEKSVHVLMIVPAFLLEHELQILPLGKYAVRIPLWPSDADPISALARIIGIAIARSTISGEDFLHRAPLELVMH